MKFDFTINDCTFELGALVEPGTLKNAALQRAGLFKRLVDRIPLASNRYDAMNCTLACFKDKFSLYPCTHRYLNKDRQWRTRASVFSQKDKIHRILKLITLYQIIPQALQVNLQVRHQLQGASNIHILQKRLIPMETMLGMVGTLMAMVLLNPVIGLVTIHLGQHVL